jgi:hypothetical protein
LKDYFGVVFKIEEKETLIDKIDEIDVNEDWDNIEDLNECEEIESNDEESVENFKTNEKTSNTKK